MSDPTTGPCSHGKLNGQECLHCELIYYTDVLASEARRVSSLTAKIQEIHAKLAPTKPAPAIMIFTGEP